MTWHPVLEEADPALEEVLLSSLLIVAAVAMASPDWSIGPHKPPTMAFHLPTANADRTTAVGVDILLLCRRSHSRHF